MDRSWEHLRKLTDLGALKLLPVALSRKVVRLALRALPESL